VPPTQGTLVKGKLRAAAAGIGVDGRPRRATRVAAHRPWAL